MKNMVFPLQLTASRSQNVDLFEIVDMLDSDQSGSIGFAVSKNDEFCIQKMMKFVLKMMKFVFLKNDESLIQHETLCFGNGEFCRSSPST